MFPGNSGRVWWRRGDPCGALAGGICAAWRSASERLCELVCGLLVLSLACAAYGDRRAVRAATAASMLVAVLGVALLAYFAVRSAGWHLDPEVVPCFVLCPLGWGLVAIFLLLWLGPASFWTLAWLHLSYAQLFLGHFASLLDDAPIDAPPAGSQRPSRAGRPPSPLSL